MEKFIAMVLSLFTVFSSSALSSGYENQAALSGAVNALFHKKEIISTKYTGIPDDYCWNGEPVDLNDYPEIVKPKDRDLVILNITDGHFADYDYRAFTAFECESTVRKLVKEVKPDLITVTGDIVCTDSDVFAIKRFTDLMESFGIPWAPVYGNHDDEGNCDLNYLADIMMKSPHCLMQKGDPEMGVGNYAIRIAEVNESGTKELKEVVVMLDSHHSQPNEKQTRWVGAVAKAAGNAEVSLFFHIPLPDYQIAYSEAWDEENKTWKNGYDAYGELHEKVCCERDADGNPLQRGFFAAIKSAGNIRQVFCGHEHLNNFSIKYQGIRMTYTMKLGFGSGFRIQFNGGTVITVGSSGINSITHKTKSLFGFKDIISITTGV